MSGDMIVPNLPQPGGTPYVWPGVQSGNGVLQAVLDGRSGTWWIGDGFFGTPSLPWGNGFNVNPGEYLLRWFRVFSLYLASGDTVHFTFSLSGSTWTCTLSSNGKSATTTLNITGNTMNRAIFAAELYDVPFNFGPIVYRNVKITATTPASQWCGGIAHLGSYPFTVTGNTASGNTCNIASITQNNA
ncbi:hypothetical protein VKT23_007536 [Stygiomarasmius scandens]|uniref:Uncharacterized protein n=1 Tax=Marasmiellus scandens TaxID=2682957 RepID=A0ABR1JLC2_9AGAR